MKKAQYSRKEIIYLLYLLLLIVLILFYLYIYLFIYFALSRLRNSIFLSTFSIKLISETD